MLWARYFLWKGRIDWLDSCLTLSLTERCLRKQGRRFSAPTVWPAKWPTCEPGWVEVPVFKIPWKATQVSYGTGFQWRNRMVNPNRIFIGGKKKQNGYCQWVFLLGGGGGVGNKMVIANGFFYWGDGGGGKKKQNGHCQWEFYWGGGGGGEETKWSLPLGVLLRGGWGERRNKMVTLSGSFTGGKKKQNGILHGAERSKMITSDGTKRSLLGLKETKWSFNMMGQK